MKYEATIFVKAAFVGYHRYVGAPDDVSFLREWHRHVFHVKLWFKVDHLNRDLEFFQQQRKLKKFLDLTFEGQRFEKSCEMIAVDILEVFKDSGAEFCEVSEDGENGAFVSVQKEFIHKE